jgi:hypothetical protein
MALTGRFCSATSRRVARGGGGAEVLEETGVVVEIEEFVCTLDVAAPE